MDDNDWEIRKKEGPTIAEKLGLSVENRAYYSAVHLWMEFIFGSLALGLEWNVCQVAQIANQTEMLV